MGKLKLHNLLNSLFEIKVYFSDYVTVKLIMYYMYQ
jgi:hypothetical protein